MNQPTNPNLLTITSVPAEKLDDSQLQVVARWKDTDKRPIPAANRVRAVILPATIWTGTPEVVATTNDPLRLFILDGIADLAKDYLSTIVEESNWLRTQVNADAFTLSALLNWSAERAALSGRLNGEEIKKWLESSHTIKAISAKHGKEIANALGETLVKLASPNPGLTPEKASKILANLWDVQDTASNTGLRVQLRLTALSKKTDKPASVLDSIL